MKKIIFFLLMIPNFCYTQKVKFIAAGVTCSMCSNAIHNSLKLDKSIEKVTPNLQTQEWYLDYKEGQFKLEDLKKRVEDAGFSLSKVWFNDKLILNNTKKKRKTNDTSNN